MWFLTKAALLLSVAVVSADHGYSSKACTSINSCSKCTDSVNAGITDFSKCIPIQSALIADESSFLGTKEITCASWDSVQKSNYTIDYQCNNEEIPVPVQTEISDLKYNVKWAFYVYSAKKGDTLLKDMKIFENLVYETKVVMGYDADRNFLVTSFRGTTNLINWLSDANFPKTNYTAGSCQRCQVHTGFLNSYNSLAKDVQAYIAVLKASYPTARVVVTGHSLGAAQAVLGAIDFQLDGYSVYLYTYGAPRVGESNFAAFLNSFVTATNLRAVYINDPVPNVPPITLGYLHGGNEIHFYGCSEYLADPQAADDGQVFNLQYTSEHMLYPCISPQATAQ